MKKKTVFYILGCISGIIQPGDVGIIVDHYKDPDLTTSIMECQQGFDY